MGRPRTPTKILDARGAFKNHPDRKRDDEPVVSEPLGGPPDWFSEEEAAMWIELASRIPPGVATDSDWPVMCQCAVMFAKFKEAPSKFTAAEHGRLSALLGKFGFSPSDRASLGVGKQKDENPFDDFLR